MRTTNFSSGNVSVLINNGDGTFAAKNDYATGASFQASSSATSTATAGRHGGGQQFRNGFGLY